jgi:peroxiredoxin
MGLTFPRWAALVMGMLIVSTPRAGAEFKVGSPLPDFALKMADSDSTFSVQRQQNRLIVMRGNERHDPKALVLHMLQPDCLQCQAEMKALEAIHQEFEKQGVLVVGVGHRGDERALRSLAKHLNVTFPLLTGTGSAFAKEFSAGDSLAITDQTGVVRFGQVGYGDGDERIWRDTLSRLLAGKPVAQETVARKRLQVNDRFPVVEFPSVMTGKTIALTGDDGRLTFRSDDGKVTHPKAAIGFFSRY